MKFSNVAWDQLDCQMKAKLLLLIIFLIYSLNASAYSGFFWRKHVFRKIKTHLVILSGQSNMVGVDKHYFKFRLNTLWGHKTVVIKEAESGKLIKYWYDIKTNSTRYIYKNMMEKVELVQSIIRPATITFIWHQGESNSRNEDYKTYKESFLKMIEKLKTDTNRKDIKVIIVRISDFGVGNNEGPYLYWDEIRQIQEDLAHENDWRLISTDDLNGFDDDSHYSPEGYRSLAERLASATYRLIF